MRVIKCGYDEQEITCTHCGATLGYCKRDVKEDNTGRFNNLKGKPLQFVICPQCNQSVNLNYDE